jgi:hypothetical protein
MDEPTPPSSDSSFHETWEIKRNEIEIDFDDSQALLGEGGWGKVYRVIRWNPNVKYKFKFFQLANRLSDLSQ